MGATGVSKQLTSEVQTNKETPQNFLIRVMDLRIKHCSNNVNPVFIQLPDRQTKISSTSLFVHNGLPGLYNDYIRTDLQSHLQQTNTVAAEKLSIAGEACASITSISCKSTPLTSGEQ